MERGVFQREEKGKKGEKVLRVERGESAGAQLAVPAPQEGRPHGSGI